MVVMKCLNCGNEFDAKRKTAKYCSEKCRKRFKRGTQNEITCVICGKTFKQSQGGRKYCSDECSETARVLDQRFNNQKRNSIYDHDPGYDIWDW